ncbi:MAG: hypothetical protein WC378_19135 [Opitutaceae bacterium]|jgi:hypothetical protein
MARATEIVEVKRIVVSVGGKDLSLSVEEARDLYRVLGDLVGPKDAAPLIVREVILSPPPVPMIVPYVPYQPSTTPMYPGPKPWESPFWCDDVRCEGSNATVRFTASSGAD